MTSINHKSLALEEKRKAADTSMWTFAEPSSSRALILLAFGAIVGLGIAGFTLFTARGTATHFVPPEDVALVNQRPILRTDLIAQAEAQLSELYEKTSAAQRKKVLNDMIREELFVQRGLELDFPGTDPDTRTALVAAVEQQVVADVTTHKASEEELMSYYTQHRDAYSNLGLITLHNLLLPLADESKNRDADNYVDLAINDLRSGKPLSEVKTAYGLKELGDGDEQFYFAEKIHIGDELYEVAVKLKNGEVSSPIIQKDGVHIIQVVKNVLPVPMDFAHARNQVENDMKIEASNQLSDADEKYLRAKAEILIAEDFK